MIKYTFTLLMCLLPIITAVRHDEVERGFIDPRLQPFVDMFEQYGKEYMSSDFTMPTITMTIQHVDMVNFDMASEVVGACSVIPFLPNKIVISENAWNFYGYTIRKQLIFHELGHCILYRGHVYEYLHDGRPSSIMHPYMALSSHDYLINKNYYLEELFSKGIQTPLNFLIELF